MIKELRLKNWKSFEDATLYIDPLTIMIGPNASGKSNALDALLFLHRVSSGVGIFQAINGDVDLPALRGGMEWVCLNPYKNFSLRVLISGENGNLDYDYTLRIVVNGIKAEVVEEKLTCLTYGIEGEITNEQEVFTTHLGNSGTQVLSTTFYMSNPVHGIGYHFNRSQSVLYQTKTMVFPNGYRHIEKIIQSVLLHLSKIFVFHPIPENMRSYTALSERLNSDGSNIAGVLAGLDEPRKAEVENTLASYLKLLPERDIKRIWAEPIGRFRSDAMLYCEEGWEKTSGNEIDARAMSDGTLHFLAVVTALLVIKEGSLLIIDEVDNGLHPSRARLLIDMLRTLGKERGIDVIVTTHNPALLDAAGISMLPFITVAHRDNKTGVSQLIQLEDIQQLPKLMAAGSLGRLNTEGRIESALKYEDAQ